MHTRFNNHLVLWSSIAFHFMPQTSGAVSNVCLIFNERSSNLVLGLDALALFLLLGYISAENFGSAWWVIDGWSAVRKVITRNIKRIQKRPGIMKIISNQCNVGSSPCKQRQSARWDQCGENDSKPDIIQMSCTLYKCTLIDLGTPAQQMQMMSLICSNVFTMQSEIKA